MLRLPSLLTVCLTIFLLSPSSSAGDSRSERPPKLPRPRKLSVKSIATLKTGGPTKTLKPAYFHHVGRRGWVVRMPTPRAAPVTTDNSRLATVPSPAVSDGRVYAGTGFDGWSLYAFRADTGKHAWTTDFEDNGPTTPTITPRKLICNTESCTTYAITPRTGKIAWARWVGPSVMGAAAVKGGVVYAAHRTKSNAYMLKAMRLSDGEVLWERSLTRDIYGKPILANGRIYVGCRDGVVSCFEINGRPLWFSRPGTSCAPWVTKDGVYVSEGSAYRKGPPAVRCLHPDTGVTLWRTDTEERVGRRNAPNEPRVTNVVRLMSQYGSDGPRPVVIGSRCILAGGRDLIAFDAQTGDVRWMRQLPEGRRFHAPPAVLGTHLLFATLHGLLLEVSAKSGKVTQGLDLRGFVSSQPVVAEGRVHVTSGELLYGIPWGDGKGPSWPQWGGLDPRTPAAPVTGN